SRSTNSTIRERQCSWRPTARSSESSNRLGNGDPQLFHQVGGLAPVLRDPPVHIAAGVGLAEAQAGATNRDRPPGHITGSREVIDPNLQIRNRVAEQHDPLPQGFRSAHQPARRVVDEVRRQQLAEDGQAAVIESLLDQATKDTLVLAGWHRSPLRAILTYDSRRVKGVRQAFMPPVPPGSFPARR